MIHSYSRVVLTLLKKAAESNTRFSVYVTEARPSDVGVRAIQELTESNIPCQLILDAAVGYFMARCDMVLVGAEGLIVFKRRDCREWRIVEPDWNIPNRCRSKGG